MTITRKDYLASILVAIFTVGFLDLIIHFPFNIYEAFAGCIIGVTMLLSVYHFLRLNESEIKVVSDVEKA